jgi:Ca2+-binding EF-hand superfamily protein
MFGVMGLGAAHAGDVALRTTDVKTTDEVEQTFAALDRDDDKLISKQEAQRRTELRDRFEGVDASGDGYLSRNEFRARPNSEPFE